MKKRRLRKKLFDDQLHIAVTNEQKAKLDELAMWHGTTASEVVRRLIASAHAQKGKAPDE